MALEYLDEPWFNCVLGNHEKMAVEFYKGIWPIDNYVSNGGEWFVNLTYDDRRKYVDAFEQLPLAIEVQTKFERVGLVHAQVPYNEWCCFETMFRHDLEAVALWSRTKINTRDPSPVVGIDKVYVGHTVLNEPCVLGNVHYIDIGACFYNRDLVLRKL